MDRLFYGKKQVLFYSIIFVLFLMFVLPAVANFTTATIGVSESPDTGLFYTYERFYNILDSYGQNGRNLYILLRWTFDLVWPLAYGAFLLSSIGYLEKQLDKKQKFVLLPIIAVMFDYLENILATIHMAIYPTKIISLVYVLQFFSLIKWASLSLAFLILLLLLGRLLYNKVKETR